MNKFRMAKAGINVNEGITRLCGDAEMFEQLLIKFLDDTHYEELKAAIEHEDVKEAFAAAHALKGIAGNMSMTKLFDAVVPCVETLRADSLEVEEYMPAIEEAYQKVYAAIEDMKNGPAKA